MDIDRFREFVTLAEYLNFRIVSERHNLSQPTLSRHISQLEADLHVQLFERDTQSVRLTNMGQMFLPEAIKIVNSYDQALASLDALRNGVTGQLSIGFKPAYGEGAWGAILSRFKEQYPEIMLDIDTLTNFVEISEKLSSGKIDVSMMLDSGQLAQNFRAIQLISVPLCAAVNKNSAIAENDKLRCEDLNGHTLVMPHTARASDMLPSMVKFLHSRGLANCKVKYSMDFDETIMHINLNNCIAVMPRCYFPSSSNNFFQIKIMEISDACDIFHLYILARKNNSNPAVGLFFSTCEDVLNHMERQG